MRKADIDAEIAKYTHLKGLTFDIEFDRHQARAQLLSIEKRPVTGFKLAPDKRLNEDGKNKVPDLLCFIFDDGKITFPIEDMTPVFYPNGIDLCIGETVIKLRSVL